MANRRVFVKLENGLAIRAWDELPRAAQDQPCEAQLRLLASIAVQGMVPDRRRGAHVLNACGELHGALQSRRPTHVAWRRVGTLFGVEWQAYTTAGNVSLQFQRVVFKGATDPAALGRAERRLFADMADPPLVPRLKLVVLQTSLGRSLYVNIGCLLERQLAIRAATWARVCGRCEEICNVVPFYITDWNGMLAALGLLHDPEQPGGNTVVAALTPPSHVMVSVSRRGVLMLRATWPGMVWSTNDGLLAVTEALGRFVGALV